MHGDRRSHYDWLKSDPTYRARYQEAHSEACDRLRSEARRRAVEGVEEPVYYQGVECGRFRKYSDILLIFLMKGAMPQEFVHFAGRLPSNGLIRSDSAARLSSHLNPLAPSHHR